MIVFGLGNPGDEYLFSRHNIGFMVVDAIALKKGFKFKPWRQSLRAMGRYSQAELWLVKPMTYMNCSGDAVKQTLKENPDQYIVIVDDVDLDFGRILLRKHGGTSGHNGLASICSSLGSEDFPRLRVGVGPRPDGAELSDYVLSSFSKQELEELPDIINRAKDAILLAASRGIDVAMNHVNSFQGSG